MPGRSANPSDYRFGYNGKEDDGKIKGEGNSYNYGMRIYDPRVERFPSPDPLIHEKQKYLNFPRVLT
jgi:RHS repeat-associated protein